jgi:hypothetical protein
MTLGILAATIRQLPGIRGVSRYQKDGKDRLYLSFSLSEPCTGVYIELPGAHVTYNTRQVNKWNCGELWRSDPRGLGGRAVSAVRELCEVYRRERVEELQRSLTA